MGNDGQYQCGAFDIATTIPDEHRPRLVIVGGGFAGLYLAKHLKHADLQIVMLDRVNFHTFQPLLYQVATAMLEPDAVAYSFRQIFKKQYNFHFRLVEVKRIDPEHKMVETNCGCLAYDFLVIATGASTNCYGMQDVAEHAFFMKDVSQAIAIRQRILKNFEKALLTDNVTERQCLMNIVIVGGGATGIEIAGAIAELENFVLPYDYRELDLRNMRIYLLEATDRLMAGMSNKAARIAAAALTKLGVEVWCDTKVGSYNGRTVVTADGRRLHAGMLIWVAGVTGNIPAGLVRAEIVPGDRVKVNSFNQVIGYDDIYAIGDVAAVVAPDTPKGHPMLAPVAIQQARNLAKNLVANRAGCGERWRHFRYQSHGIMATIGRNCAVVERPGLSFGGFPAWLTWLFVHLLSIVGFRNKIIALSNWAWNYLTYDRGIRLIIPMVQDRDNNHNCRRQDEDMQRLNNAAQHKVMSTYLQTGQITCHDARGNMIDCTGSGQDADFSSGVSWPAPRFEVHENEVLDRLTGLVWTRNANLADFPLTWQAALDYIAMMNRDKVLGSADWRLPNRRELRSLMSHQTRKPALPEGHPFVNVFNGWYWTSTTAAINPAYAWYIHMEGARMFYGQKEQFFLLWPVRGKGDTILPATGQTQCYDAKGQLISCAGSRQDGEVQAGVRWPAPRFEEAGSMVVDRLTNLCWRASADLFGRHSTWEEALKAVADLNQQQGGAYSWRLPNINELESLVDCSAHSPALPHGHPFIDVRDGYWSATTSMFEPDWAWALYLTKGAVGVGQKRGAHFSVWAVCDLPARE